MNVKRLIVYASILSAISCSNSRIDTHTDSIPSYAFRKGFDYIVTCNNTEVIVFDHMKSLFFHRDGTMKEKNQFCRDFITNKRLRY